MTVQQPIYTPYPEIHHIRKFESYGAADKATTRDELVDLIRQAIKHPEQKAEQRRVAITRELGPLDGKVKDRLVDYCCSNASGKKSANRMNAS
jgi:CDP-glycerol glycerophosphotransferase (TagB/SpsB family)